MRRGLPQCGSGRFWAALAASVQFTAVQGGSGCLSAVQGCSGQLGLLLWVQCSAGCLRAVQGSSGRLGLLLRGEVSLTDGEQGLPRGAGGQVAGPGLCEVRQLPLQVL